MKGISAVVLALALAGVTGCASRANQTSANDGLAQRVEKAELAAAEAQRTAREAQQTAEEAKAKADAASAAVQDSDTKIDRAFERSQTK